MEEIILDQEYRNYTTGERTDNILVDEILSFIGLFGGLLFLIFCLFSWINVEATCSLPPIISRMRRLFTQLKWHHRGMIFGFILSTSVEVIMRCRGGFDSFSILTSCLGSMIPVCMAVSRFVILRRWLTLWNQVERNWRTAWNEDILIMWMTLVAGALLSIGLTVAVVMTPLPEWLWTASLFFILDMFSILVYIASTVDIIRSHRNMRRCLTSLYEFTEMDEYLFNCEVNYSGCILVTNQAMTVITLPSLICSGLLSLHSQHLFYLLRFFHLHIFPLTEVARSLLWLPILLALIFLRKFLFPVKKTRRWNDTDTVFSFC